MANEEQLKILKQGVEVWNQWREEYPNIKPDLNSINLNGVNLAGINLQKANLNYANLSVTNLRKAELNGASLGMTILGSADLTGANLIEADLIGASLVHANLSQATLTGANLYGTAYDDWKIDGIICEYVYRDLGRKKRIPKDRDFEPGEFEEGYKQFPTFEYAFEHGITLIDIGIIKQIVNDITALHPEWELKLDSFHSRGQPHANFTIREQDLIAQAFERIKINYEATLNRLKGQYEESNLLLSRFMRELTNRPQLVLNGDIIVGDKNIGRDNIEISDQAHVNHLTTGDSKNDTSDSSKDLKINNLYTRISLYFALSKAIGQSVVVIYFQCLSEQFTILI